MLLDFSDTQDEMDKLAFTLDRNKFSRSSSFTAGQDAEPVDSKPQVSQGRFEPLPLYMKMHGPMTCLLTNVASKSLSGIPFIASIVGIEGGESGKGVAGASPQHLFYLSNLSAWLQRSDRPFVYCWVIEEGETVMSCSSIANVFQAYKSIDIGIETE